MTGGLSRGGSDYVYALMRIVVGLAFAQHGAQKLLGLFGAPTAPARRWKCFR